jgi:hypothetical protein
MPELHPFKDYVNLISNFKGGYLPISTKVVIMGTFPPKIEYLHKGKGFFFYSSERNHLWNRMDNINANNEGYVPLKKTAGRNHNETFIQNRDRKMAFCDEKDLGFLDLFSIIDRAVEGSTKDEDIISLETILENGSFQSLIETHHIKRICCVYTLAYNTLLDQLPNYGFNIITNPCELSANGLIHRIQKGERNFELVLLYPATRSGDLGILKDEQYNHFLFNT